MQVSLLHFLQIYKGTSSHLGTAATFCSSVTPNFQKMPFSGEEKPEIKSSL